MNNVLKLFFKFLSDAVGSCRIDDNITINDQEAEMLYELAKLHDLAHLVCYSIERNSIVLNNVKVAKKFKKQLMLSVVRYERQNSALEQIKKIFNENEIKFIPLKGAVIRGFYPEPWMRTGSDVDILVCHNDIKRAQDLLMEKSGYSLVSVGNHDVSLFSPDGVHIELHFSLSDIRNDDEYLENVWKFAKQKDSDLFEYCLTDDMFYHYHIYHMAKHFLNGGCGIKPFLDICVMKKHFETNFKRMVDESTFCKFANKMEEQSDIWFESANHTEMSDKIQEYIVSGGVYGSTQNKQAMKKNSKKTVISYYLSRIWLPFSILKLQYPVLEKNVWLLPFYQFKRWFCISFNAKKYIKNEFAPVKVEQERTTFVSELKKELGL